MEISTDAFLHEITPPPKQHSNTTCDTGCWRTSSLHGSALVLVYSVAGSGLEKVCDVVWPRWLA